MRLCLECNSNYPICCSGNCTNLSTDRNNCGRCGAPPCTGNPPACCTGTCADLSSSSSHCGSCNTTVSSCALALFELFCFLVLTKWGLLQCNSANPVCCSGNCTNLATDRNHCGSCTAAPCTGSIPACCSGVCTDLGSSLSRCGSCTASPCTGNIPACCSGACADLSSSALHCGSCNITVSDYPSQQLTEA